jgi:hypothetical protein
VKTDHDKVVSSDNVEREREMKNIRDCAVVVRVRDSLSMLMLACSWGEWGSERCVWCRWRGGG